MQFKFASLHPCETFSLLQRVKMFLPSAKAEALDKVVGLVKNYSEYYKLAIGEEEYVEIAELFLQNLQPEHLLDTKYINEGNESALNLDSSWRECTDVLTQLCNQVTEKTGDEVKEEKMKLKRKKRPNKLSIPRKPRRENTGKRRRTLHDPCDDPSCCKDEVWNGHVK